MYFFVKSGVVNLGLASLFSLLFLGVGAEAAGTKITVVDGPADLSHIRLKGLLNVNAAEQGGKTGVDDDKNGFVDDVLGWNAASNNPQYMPAATLKLFQDNRDAISQIFDLYNRVELEEPEAVKSFNSLPADSRNTVSLLLKESHGTHVSGIAALASQGTARLQNLNIMSQANDLKVRLSGALSAATVVPATVDSLFDWHASALSAFESLLGVQAKRSLSFFDDRTLIDAALVPVQKRAREQSRLLARYLGANEARVVNMSIAQSLLSTIQLVEGIWQEELAKANLSPKTKRTKVQQENYIYAIQGIWLANSKKWQDIFDALPNTLFVIAAGNDGVDLSKNPTLPAQLAKTQRNAITVAATDQDGLITDFSNYNAEIVSLGAFGKAVISYAPGGIEGLRLSGTSMASPQVAGVATQIFEINPDLKPADVRRILEGTTADVGSLQGKTITGGQMSPETALDAARRSNHVSLEDAIRTAKYYGDTPIRPMSRWAEGLSDRLPHSTFREMIDTFGKVSVTSDIVKGMMRQR